MFISYNDIPIANVDNLSEGLMKDTEEENKVLHFVQLQEAGPGRGAQGRTVEEEAPEFQCAASSCI